MIFHIGAHLIVGGVEYGLERRVARYVYFEVARIVGRVVVRPAHEVIARFGRGRQLVRSCIFVCAAARHTAEVWIIGTDIDFVRQRIEQCFECSIGARNNRIRTRIGCAIAIAPTFKFETRIGCCFNRQRCAKIPTLRRRRYRAKIVTRLGGYMELPRFEVCLKRSIVRFDRIAKRFVRFCSAFPIVKLITFGRRSRDGNIGAKRLFVNEFGYTTLAAATIDRRRDGEIQRFEVGCIYRIVGHHIVRHRRIDIAILPMRKFITW